MLSFDEVVAIEIYSEQQKIQDNGSDAWKALLIYIVGALQAGDTIKTIKRYIHSYQMDTQLEAGIQQMIEDQAEYITGERKSFSLGAESMAGFTFAENIRNRIAGNRHRTVSFMARAKELLKDGKSVRDLIRNEVDKYIRQTEAFYRTEAKAGREHAYEKVDAKGRSKIRGWISVAVLDNKTSAICIGLHNRFYTKKKYGSRVNVPERPPRHPNCRSILLTVYEGVNITKYKGDKIETFLRRNPHIAKDIMGIEKYRLWSGGKAKVARYIDIKGKRFFTNEEIVKRLGIKSRKRLSNIKS